MATEFVVKLIDRTLKPWEWYQYDQLLIQGYQLISTKAEQKNAGLLQNDSAAEKTRLFGPNPIKPYRDYYGEFILTTRLYPERLTVKFALGYTILSKVVTVDDYSNLGWLRLATGMPDILYPNLADQKQLLNYFLRESKFPPFLVTRVYHYLQETVYRQVAAMILQREEA